MRIPMQHVPVARGVSRSRHRARVAMSSWGSCMVSCLESTLGVSGLNACANLTSTSKFVSCAIGILKAAGSVVSPEVVAIDAAGCAVGCLV